MTPSSYDAAVWKPPEVPINPAYAAHTMPNVLAARRAAGWYSNDFRTPEDMEWSANQGD